MAKPGHSIADLHLIGEFVKWAMSTAKTADEKADIAHIFVGDIQFYTSNAEFPQIAASLVKELTYFLEHLKPDDVVK